MDFRSIYQHGFARVAACTGSVAIADPPVNAEMVVRQARACSEEGVVVALFPELTLTGYSIEDLLLQDAVLDDVEAALATVVEASADLLPLIVLGAPLRHRNRIYNCAVVVHRGRVLGVVPKSYPPTYREFYEGRQLASGVGERGEIRVARPGPPVRPEPAVRRRRPPRAGRARRDLRGHVDPGHAERRGGARRRDAAAQPLGQPDHGRPGRGPQAAVPLGLLALPGRLRLLAPPARASRPPTWRGTARRRSTRTASCSPRRSASRRATSARSPTSTSTCCSRSGGGWGRSTTTGARTPSAPATSARSGSRSTRPTATSASCARSSATRSSPPTSPASTSTATRPTTSRSPGCSSGCGRSGTRRSSSASPAGSTRPTR